MQPISTTVWKEVTELYDLTQRMLFYAVQDHPDDSYAWQQWLRALDQKIAAQKLWLNHG